jgi:mevalonate kinase
MTIAYAPGKVILFGEHAVVYGRPAIAVPVTQVQARAEVTTSEGGLILAAPDLDRRYAVMDAPPDDPLALTVRNTLAHLGVSAAPDLCITVTSTIPMARGLGSGAAIATAIVRALAGHFGRELPPAEVSALVFQTEVLYHGTPSGIDNTVIAFGQPVYFVKGQPLERFAVGAPLRLAIGDTGVASPTSVTVGDVRRGWQSDPRAYEVHFDAIAGVVVRARQAIETGDLPAVGRLMDENHAHLRALGVSSPELERLIEAARAAGALGAKLSGGGRGGNMIALVTPETERTVTEALQDAGAVGVIVTEVNPFEGNSREL